MSKQLLIIGAGGHGQVVKEVIIGIENKKSPKYSRIDFLDDNAENAIDKIDNLEKYVGSYEEVFCGIGNNSTRKAILERAEKLGFEIPTFIHPTAYISPTATIGKGTIIEPKSIVNANSHIGEGCIISVGAIIDHDVVVSDYAHVNAGAICTAGSDIAAGRKLEAGEVAFGYETAKVKR